MVEDLHRVVLDNAPWGVIVASTELSGRCHYLNPEFTRITGYALSDVPTVKDWIERAYPDADYRDHVVRSWPDDTSPDGMHRDVVYRVTCRDGTSKHLQFRAALLEPGQMIVMVLDVSSREEAEQERQDTEDRYRLLVETSPFGIVLHSGDRIDFANAAALRIIGAERPEQVVGRPVLDFVHPDSVEAAVQRMAEARETGIAAVPDEERFVRLDGSIIDVAVSGAVVPHRRQLALQVVLADITEQKRLEREQRSLEQRMMQAQRTESLALLAGGVAHDLNNLLVGIQGHADLARRAAERRAELEGHLQAVLDSARGAADLAGQLLAYAGRRQLSVETVSLNTVLADTEGLLLATVRKQVELRFELLDDLPMIAGDVIQLRQILLNLVSNAAEAIAGSGGHITLCTRCVEPADAALRDAFAPRSPQDVPHVVLEVSDDGPGMDASTRDRVFDPFFTTKASGRGLGLAAAVGIVRAHGAAITVQSEPGAGTTFRVYLPAAPGGATVRPPEEDLALQWRGEGMVLVVDDEASVRRVVATMLRRAGFEVIEADNGRQALERLVRAPQQIVGVVLDMNMPGMSGEQTFRELRSIRSDLPIVLSSGLAKPDVGATPGDVGRVTYLPKPYGYDGLVGALRHVLGPPEPSDDDGSPSA
jgi:PAS domain S-box-containing protein